MCKYFSVSATTHKYNSTRRINDRPLFPSFLSSNKDATVWINDNTLEKISLARSLDFEKEKRGLLKQLKRTGKQVFSMRYLL